MWNLLPVTVGADASVSFKRELNESDNGNSLQGYGGDDRMLVLLLHTAGMHTAG